jgi:hypothetical protein
MCVIKKPRKGGGQRSILDYKRLWMNEYGQISELVSLAFILNSSDIKFWEELICLLSLHNDFPYLIN